MATLLDAKNILCYGACMERLQRVMRAFGNPFVLFSFTLIVALGLFALRHIPADKIFSGEISALEFFRLPILQFYLALLFLWVELLERLGVLPLLLALAALGVLYASAPHITAAGKARFGYILLILAELLLLGVSLHTLLVPPRPFAVSVAFLCILTF
ncbi:MAG: hypothetical protein U1A28_03310, partial [Patescibacteria group bacterium]|nr:hypothetical protein [Patescibacteria group bacterium]